MRTLIISHNVFSTAESMGKTLSAYFSGFNPDDLSQFYIHSQVPTSGVCHNYYRITDKEAICSIVGFKCGTSFTAANIDCGRVDSRTDSGVSAALYQKARKRTPLIYIVRNLWWKLARWNSRSFRRWVDDFNPDCIFLASGDYAFIYNIARKIAKSRNIPLYVSCMDDYYIFNKNGDTKLGRLQHCLFMKAVRKTIEYASAIFCICEKMSEDYSSLFQKKCITIHTPFSISESIKVDKKVKISYLGNLGLGRDGQLIAIGQALKKLGLCPNYVDVYSSESRKEILDGMCEKNGIHFHGAVSAEEVETIMKESMAIIHTESFDDRSRRNVRYSVSTKIADSLASGTCIFAYGPEEIASMSYLKKSKAAICCTASSDLEVKLRELIQNTDLRNRTVECALYLARANHLPECTPSIIGKEINSRGTDINECGTD